MKKLWLAGLPLLGTLALAAENPISREKLLQGSEFPERREFPVSEAHPPCENFYEFACHQAVANFKLREDRKGHTFSFGDSRERLLYAKQQYLKALPGMSQLSERATAIRDVYGACMNEEAGKQEERELVKQEIAKITSIQTLSDFRKLLASRIDRPERGFVTYETIPNQDDPRWEDVLFDLDVRSFPERSYYENPEAIRDLEVLAGEFFKTIGLDQTEARAKSVVDFEKALDQHYPKPADIRDRVSQRNSVSRQELLAKYPALELGAFLKRIPARTKLRNLIPETLAYGNEQLEKGNLEQLKNLLLFRSVTGFMDDAYPEFFAKKFQFEHKHLGGSPARPVRQERCTRLVMDQFERELDAEVMPILYPNFPREKVVTLAERVRSALLDGLKENTWLSPKAKAAAIEKMKTARLLLVAPQNEGEWYFNPKATYSPTQRYANSILLKKNRMDREIRELGEERNRSRWLMGPLTVNAYYMPMDNVFALPLAILQYPFFDATLPMETNLAAIGSVVGHELGHGIDDKGAKYDQNGKLKSWMTKADIAAFQERGAKFISRFDKIGHNGRLTLGENIGDHVGITSAYRAAFGTKPVSLDAKKAFFLQYARSWCGILRPSYQQLLLKTDPHALGEARVNEQVRHLGAFHEAYGCQAGNAMFLPENERIRVW